MELMVINRPFHIQARRLPNRQEKRGRKSMTKQNNNVKGKNELTGIKLSEPLTSLSIPIIVQNGTVTEALAHKQTKTKEINRLLS